MDIYFAVEYWVVRIEWPITELYAEYKYQLIVFRYISFHWWECLPKRSSDLIVSHQFLHAYKCYHNTDPWVRKIHWRRKWQPTPVLLPGKSHDRGAWLSYSPGDCRVRHNWATEHAHTSGMSLWQVIGSAQEAMIMKSTPAPWSSEGMKTRT